MDAPIVYQMKNMNYIKNIKKDVFNMLNERLNARGYMRPLIWYDSMYELNYSMCRQFNNLRSMKIKLIDIMCITKNILNMNFNKPHDNIQSYILKYLEKYLCFLKNNLKTLICLYLTYF